MDDVVDKMIEVELLSDDNFLKIRETLTRMGVASYSRKKFFQSCHILHKRGKYYIVHFKELFELDGKLSNFSEEDKIRRDKIIDLLEQWKLLIVCEGQQRCDLECEAARSVKLKVLPYKEKHMWELVAKYTLGKGSK